MTNNPYTLLFGKAPYSIIPRDEQLEMVTTAFCREEINEQAYLIAGVRGSGKTVFMSEVANRLDKRKEWVVIDLNAERDLLQDFVSILNTKKGLKKIFERANINLSYFGFGVDIKNVQQITNIQMAAQEMLKSLADQGKRVLVTIDEVANSRSIREFAHAFQSFIRKGLPVFLLATGLYENINDLQSEKSSTFLYRVPKIEMQPLYSGFIADNYQKTFSLSQDDAMEMAALTKGYPFAFQVLGHYTWEAKGDYRSVQDKYDSYLAAYSYEKIWSEMSAKDKELAYGIAETNDGSIKDLRANLGWTTAQISPYRDRLIGRGVVRSTGYGHVGFTLPAFDKFVRKKKKYEEEWELDN